MNERTLFGRVMPFANPKFCFFFVRYLCFRWNIISSMMVYFSSLAKPKSCSRFYGGPAPAPLAFGLPSLFFPEACRLTGVFYAVCFLVGPSTSTPNPYPHNSFPLIIILSYPQSSHHHHHHLPTPPSTTPSKSKSTAQPNHNPHRPHQPLIHLPTPPPHHTLNLPDLSPGRDPQCEAKVFDA